VTLGGGTFSFKVEVTSTGGFSNMVKTQNHSVIKSGGEKLKKNETDVDLRNEQQFKNALH
jgi:hypothetical protein